MLQFTRRSPNDMALQVVTTPAQAAIGSVSGRLARCSVISLSVRVVKCLNVQISSSISSNAIDIRSFAVDHLDGFGTGQPTPAYGLADWALLTHKIYYQPLSLFTMQG